jgi:predicted DNA binding CopG/RHH family protein
MAQSKKVSQKISDEKFLMESFDFNKAVWIKGGVPTKSEALKMTKDKKEARFTARVSEHDFETFKKTAAEKGIGYQTLLGQIIHEYNCGQLVDIKEIRKVFPQIKFKAS